ncbi:DUF423 domain-containing protein [Halothiobacillus sp.]|uniref:DUF423 domain-containing protein n=1 Tax=Halothiobacillus sp. TaxID=1891311 RepID=UPI002632A781|nr:DUF423 domain-containing protein [Halothiobacillus sp.]
MTAPRLWLLLGISNALLAVILAAAGAHGPMAPATPFLQHILSTASMFHLVHSLALIQFGLWLVLNPDRHSLVGLCLLAGTVLFVGSLYAIIFTTLPIPGVLTPIGGALLMLGWLIWGFQVLMSGKRDRSNSL